MDSTSINENDEVSLAFTQVSSQYISDPSSDDNSLVIISDAKPTIVHEEEGEESRIGRKSGYMWVVKIIFMFFTFVIYSIFRLFLLFDWCTMLAFNIWGCKFLKIACKY